VGSPKLARETGMVCPLAFCAARSRAHRGAESSNRSVSVRLSMKLTQRLPSKPISGSRAVSGLARGSLTRTSAKSPRRHHSDVEHVVNSLVMVVLIQLLGPPACVRARMQVDEPSWRNHGGAGRV